MSVIIAGMTMPNNCNDCGIVAEKAKTTCKSNGCPLKSVDGLIKQIRDEIMTLQTYKMFEGEDAVYVECEDVLQIIDKYRTGIEPQESEDKT